MSVESDADYAFASLTDADLYARIDTVKGQLRQVAGLRGHGARRVESVLMAVWTKLNDARIRRDLPPSVAESEHTAAKVAEFDRDFPIPDLSAPSPNFRSVSSGVEQSHADGDAVCTQANVTTAARLPRA